MGPLCTYILTDAFVMLITTAHFHSKHNADVREPHWSKYTREYYSGVFDNLHSKKEFRGKPSVEDFPLQPTSTSLKTLHGVIDLDEDSDGEVDAGLFAEASDLCQG